MKILFWGSPEFSLPSLEGLLENGYDIVGVVTREDKQSGRGRRIRTTPAKDFALERGLNILQPASHLVHKAINRNDKIVIGVPF